MKACAACLGAVLALGLACSGPSEREVPPGALDDQTASRGREITAQQIGADETCVRYCEALTACGTVPEGCVDGCTAMTARADGEELVRCVLDADGCEAAARCD